MAETAISVIKDIITEKEKNDLVTNQNLEITKLKLIQEIELVRKDTLQIKLVLTQEIELVRKDTQQIKLI